MYKCNFCPEDNYFPSRQSLYAHLRWCEAYKQHKQSLRAASGTCLRQAVPQAQPDQAPSPSLPSALLPHTNDPFAPFRDFLQGLGVQPPGAGEIRETQETSQHKRRRLLQAAKNSAIDQSWRFTGKPTAEMRAASRLAIERELRDEPLEEFSSQEVIELATGICDRVYSSFWSREKKETQRAQEAEKRKRAGELENERKQQERTRKKEAFLTEAQRRAVVLVKTRSFSLVQRIHMIDEILIPLDAVLTGDESLSEASTSIDTVLQARVTDWETEDAAKAAKQQDEWMEFAVVVLVIIAGGYTFVKAPGILLWLLNVFFPNPATSPGATKTPSEEATNSPSDPSIPVRRVKKIRRPPLSPFSSDNPLPDL